MIVLDNISNFITTHNLIPSGTSIVVGLSGGPDSVFLLDYLVQQKDRFGITQIVAAHLNHEWREDTHKDELFCKKICEKLNVPLVVKKLSEYEKEIKFDGSKEAYARKARRKFFQEVRSEYNADLIALAHHLQDQEETFFIRLVRGTSLSGLTCMWPKSGDYIRPLLQTNKKDIIDFLEKNNIEYLIDPTNISPEFLRNRIRAKVLPALQECDKRFDKNFLSTINRLQATETFLQEFTQKTFDEINAENGMNLDQFFAQPQMMQYRLLMHWLCESKIPFPLTQSFLDEIIRFLKQPGSKTHTIHERLHITKSKGYAAIRQ